MPTNDERREVVARLLNRAGLSIPSPIPLYLKRAVHGNYPHWITYSDSRTLERLASLIEPEPERTCCIDDSGCCGCGYPLGDWVTWRMDDRKAFLYERANYCPNCGAKVTE